MKLHPDMLGVYSNGFQEKKRACSDIMGLAFEYRKIGIRICEGKNESYLDVQGPIQIC